MYTGGKHSTPQAARIIRYAGLIVPIILLAYGYLHVIDVIQSHNFESVEALILLAIAWMIVALWQFVTPAKHSAVATVRLGFYHLFAALYLILVTGIFTPFVVFWIVLLTASYLYFNHRGVMVSIGIFMATVLVDILLWGRADTTVISYDLGVLVAVLLSGLIIMGINRAQSVDRSELQRSHDQEVLQRDRIMTIVNNLADAILSTDKDGIIRVYNAASLNLLDTNDSLNGHHIDTVLQLVDLNGKPVVLSSLLKKVSSVEMRDDLSYVFEDGQQLRLEVTISPIRKAFQAKSNGRDGYILIIRDITKAKSLEEERDEFISVVSHELRTPVTVVEGSLSNLEVMIEKPEVGQDRVLGAVKLAHEQTMYLAKMINDLSTLSRAERGVSDECEDIDVKELAQSLFATYSPEAKVKGLALDLDVTTKQCRVSASRLYLEELLQNLITNAIKYTKEGSVTLLVQRKGDDIVFSIKDTGIGISKSDQAKIFDKFYRSEDYRTRETSGTGLGLYVVSKLARKLGTNVTLTSRLNYGSTFSFTLPAHIDEK